jgi:hypothetical protein
VAAATTPSRLEDAVDQAREAAIADAAADMGATAAAEAVGEHLGARAEDGAVTHFFAAEHGGYRGWRWSVTLASADDDSAITVSEVVLLPGPDAMVSPAWVPWNERVRPGDLGVGDLLPTSPDDARLVPGYLASDDIAVEELAREVGLGRKTVLSREGRDAAVQRWFDGEHGPGTDMARSAPAHCGTCGSPLPLAGALSGVFGSAPTPTRLRTARSWRWSSAAGRTRTSPTSRCRRSRSPSWSMTTGSSWSRPAHGDG